MTDTSRTEALAKEQADRVGYGTRQITPSEAATQLWEHARQLERELTQARAKLAEAEQTIAALRVGCEQLQLSAKHAQGELDEALTLLSEVWHLVIDAKWRERVRAFIERPRP